jgi:hypothetical protein
MATLPVQINVNFAANDLVEAPVEQRSACLSRSASPLTRRLRQDWLGIS